MDGGENQGMKTYGIILASGVGSRFGGDVPKQFAKVNGRMVIEHTLSACDVGVFDELIVVVSGAYVEEMRDVIARNRYGVRVRVVEGGESRRESCANGVAAIGDECARVVVHNGVQPLVTRRCFETCLAALEKYPAVTSGVPCVYTVLEADTDRCVTCIPDRKQLFRDMGVECFRLGILREALRLSADDDVSTDIIGLIVRKGLGKVYVAPGDATNIKVTTREDLEEVSRRLGD